MFEHLALQPTDDPSIATGIWLIRQPRTRPNYLPWITYANTDILQATGIKVLCCPANLVSYSATTRHVIREYDQEEIFRLRPTICAAVHLVNSPTAPWDNEIFLLCTRASNKHPMLHEVLHLCLTNLIQQLHQNHTTRNHFPIYDAHQHATSLVCHVTRPLHGSKFRNSSPRPSLRLYRIYNVE